MPSNKIIFGKPNQASLQQCRVATLPYGISGELQLHKALSEALNFPEYYGFNWNAMSDCLRDLSWIKERTVVIVHQEIPGLTSFELSTYIDVILECTADWKSYEEHQLEVYFPKGTEHEIASACP